MRWFPAALVAAWVVVPTWAAAPIPASGIKPAPVSASLQAEAALFAKDLLQVANQITAQYVRPVKREELLAAALAAVYERARLRMADAVLRDLDASRTDEDVLRLIARAREHLGDVEELAKGEALLASFRGMARCLDRHSTVVQGSDLRRSMGVDEMNGFGLDLEEPLRDLLKIRTVFPGGPAQAAGLRPGDLITHLGGKLIKECSPLLLDQFYTRPTFQQANVSSGGLDILFDEIAVTMTRPGNEPRKVVLQRLDFQPETVLGVIRNDDNSWDYWLDPKKKIAHVRISGMGNTTAIDLRTTLDNLTDAGLKGLILDLRWCPGGYLRQAIQIASLFVPEGSLITTMSSRTEGDAKHTSEAKTPYLNFPMVVLINGETSGGAELIAAALQDHKRALIAGTRTVGKGSVQIHLPLGTDAGFKLTTRTLVRPSGQNLHRFADSRDADDWGVRPDKGLELRVSTDLDKQLKEWWTLQTLRPGPSNERLPLDDPLNDPQRQAAVDELVNKLSR